MSALTGLIMRITPVRVAVATRKKPSAVPDKVLFTANGTPIVTNVNQTQLPDPRLSACGHTCIALYIYSFFILCVVIAVLEYAFYVPTVDVGIPRMAVADPRLPLTLLVRCPQPTTVTIRSNYSLVKPSSPCFNSRNAAVRAATTTAVPTPTTTTTGPATTTAEPSAPVTSSYVEYTYTVGDSPSTNVTAAATMPPPSGKNLLTTIIDVDLCFTKYEVFLATDPEPTVNGITIAFSGIPVPAICTLAVFSRPVFQAQILPRNDSATAASTVTTTTTTTTTTAAPPAPSASGPVTPMPTSAVAPPISSGTSVLNENASWASSLPAARGLATPYALLSTALPDSLADFPAIRVLSVEGGIVKTFFIGYYDKRLKHEALRITDARAFATYYELDAERTVGDVTSVIFIRLNDVALRVVEFDNSHMFMMTGRFGQLWKFTRWPLAYLLPLLAIIFSRNFAQDEKEGRLDGYTKDLLERAWQPGFYVGFSRDVVLRGIKAFA